MSTALPDGRQSTLGVRSSDVPTVADTVVRTLVDCGIDSVFALPGVQNDHFFDACSRVGNRLRLVHTRHEQGCAYMALGAALATGKPAAFAVVPGPGVLNASAGLATAYACNAPVVAIVGQIASGEIGGGRGALHELPDQAAILAALTKWSARVSTPEDAENLVVDALWHATSGRPRPVALEVPMDLWPQRSDRSGFDRRSHPRGTESQGLVDDAAEILSDAHFPMIVVGSGAQSASDEVAGLASHICAPVVAHRMGHGVLDARSPLSLNVLAGRHLWPQVDTVIAIGTRLEVQRAWGLGRRAVIRIDGDEALGNDESPSREDRQVTLVGDVPSIVAKLVESIRPLPPRHHATIETARRRAARDVSYLEPQLSLLAAIRAALPEEGIFVDELTQLGYVSRLSFPVYRPRTYLSPGYQGTLGWGIPTALGARFARPERPVVLVTGDGGFMFNVQELATAIEHDIAITLVLVNDGAFGNVLRTQSEEFAGRVVGSRLLNPDFVALATSFGWRASRVATPGELENALARSLDSDRPTLIEVPAGPMPSPWPLLRQTPVAPGVEP